MKQRNNRQIAVKTDPESEFFIEIAGKHAEWKGRAVVKRLHGHDAIREEEYAEAYRILLNKFSQIEESL